MQNKYQNTKYHTFENGWENHEQYSDAFPFATGELALDRDLQALTESQRRGRQLFLSSCISCHDRITVTDKGAIWESYPLSWPRNGVTPQNLNSVDAVSAATPYSMHEETEAFTPGSESQQRGEILFKKNCTFCHAEDGSGKNWIGQFIQPHPRNFQQASIRDVFDKQLLKERIRNGVSGSAMPAWRYVLNEREIDDLVEFLWVRFK